jgi:NAD(P)-dependent dehydrogenase (short-subunit alcohol dehydrogenase family)
MERMHARAIATFGKVDILVNNAEAVVFKAMIDHTIEEWDRLFAVNLRSALIGVKLFLPDMLERKEGVIVTMQSSEGMPYTKQESDARGWIKDAKQLESALAALAERKETVQELADALTEGEINQVSLRA